MKLSPADNLFITIQGTAGIYGAILRDEDQMPQDRPTQAIWVTATADSNIAIDPESEWFAKPVYRNSYGRRPKDEQLATEMDCRGGTPKRHRPERHTQPTNEGTRETSHPNVPQHRQAYRLALTDPHTPGSGVADQGGALPRPLRHAQRPATRGFHRVLEFPDGRRHCGQGGRTHLAALRHSTQETGPSHATDGRVPSRVHAQKPSGVTSRPQP